MSNSLDDPFIQALMDEFGAHGYLLWFGLIEVLTKEIGSKPGCTVTLPEVYLRRKLRTKSATLRQFLTSCGAVGKLLVTFQDKNIIIEMPKLLQIRDNHTRNLQVTNKKLVLEKEKEKDKEKEEEGKAKPRKKTAVEKVVKEVSKKCIDQMEKEFPEDDVPKNLQAFYDWVPNSKHPVKNYDASFRTRMRNEYPNIKKEGGVVRDSKRTHNDLKGFLEDGK